MSKKTNENLNVDIKSTQTKKNFLKTLKILGLLALFIVSYFISAYINGYDETNKKLILLVVLVFLGFLLFFIIYAIAYLITLIKISIKQKRNDNNVVNCDEEAAKIIKNNNYQFKFDTKQSFTDNVKIYLNQTLKMVEQVADTYSKGGKYAFLNYTVYDGIDVLGNAIDVLYDKIDGFLSSKALKVFKFYDKPITFVSKELNKLLYQENEELNVVVEPKSKTVTLIKGKLKEIGAKAGKVIIRKPLNNLAGGITEFVASESVRVFSKNSSSNKIKAVKKDA